MEINPIQVRDIIRQIAEDEVLSRYRQLKSHEISEKHAGEIVTIADTEAERRLGKAFSDLLPGSLVIGEEGTSENPDCLKYLGGDAPVWIIDPVDGTKNFANGIPCFAVMTALCVKDQIEASWIHDPITNTTIHAIRSEGAWEGDKRLYQTSPASVEAMSGSFPRNLTTRLRDRQNSGETGIPDLVERYRCVGREYMDLARGKLHFLRYGGHLKPWDHAPGVLIHRETAGFDAHIKTGSPYDPSADNSSNIIMLAKDANIWKKLTQISED